MRIKRAISSKRRSDSILEVQEEERMRRAKMNS